MSRTNLRYKSNTVNEILSNFKPEMDFYLQLVPGLFRDHLVNGLRKMSVTNNIYASVFPSCGYENILQYLDV
jgi:hypothetical protein